MFYSKKIFFISFCIKQNQLFRNRQENLPFIKVEPTLYLISKAMRKGAFFSISTELEPHGPQHLNKQLHRTVQSGRYWADVLTKYWRISWDCSVTNSLLVYAYPRKENNSNAWPTGY